MKIVKVRDLEIGKKPVLIAGPCSIESKEHIINEAKTLKSMGLDILRGGAFKPRTDPNTFQGLGFSAVEYLKEASENINTPFITEIVSEDDVEEMAKYVDIFQVGSRNMYNYELLKKLGKTGKPVLLKRGFSATIEEWKLASDYIKNEGNENIIFCERGIRAFDNTLRNTLDLAGALYLKQETGRPVIIDPSHATGKRSLIKPLVAATLAAGLDGVMIEVHENPDKALTDGEQTVDYSCYKEIAKMFK